MPGDDRELREFHDHCVSRTKLAIELMCGDVHFRIPNKSFLELLYNRYQTSELLHAKYVALVVRSLKVTDKAIVM
jgi:hypothetical protein